MLLTLGALVYCLTSLRKPTPLRTISEGERLLAYEPGFMVVGVGGEILFRGASGAESTYPGHVDQAVIASDCAYVRSGQALILMSERDHAFLLDVHSSERLLQVSGSPLIFLIRPREDGTFGEAWAIRVLTQSGDPLWEATLPGVPVRAVAGADVLCVALRDVTVGSSSVAALCPDTGLLLWSVSVGPGHWRDICISQDGRVAYATKEQAGVIELSGKLGFTVLDKGHPSSVFLWDGGLAVASVDGRRATLWMLGHGGTPVWSASLPSEAAALSGDGEALVALCQNHVIRFFLEDGRREILTTTEASPLWYRDGVLLFGSGSNVRMAEIEEDWKGRGPR